METKEILRTLCEANGVSGEESSAAAVALEMLKKFDKNASTDVLGSVTGFIGDRSNGKPLVMLDAHIDEIGLIVTYIDDDGFIKVGECGGVDNRLLLAQTVTVWGKQPIKGVISTLPPHVAKETDKVAKTEDIAVDTGYSKEQLEKIISQGDKITFDSAFSELKNDRFCGKAIDDRSGVTSLLVALEKMSGKTLAYNVAVHFASREELGGQGAQTGAFRINPDYAIAVDVSFAHTPDAKAEKCGKMGGGVMIGYAPTLDKELSQKMTELAEKAKIPYAVEVMDGETGTDADEISTVRGGVKAVTLSIPEKYMHTPVEVVQISDIEATAELICRFLCGE